MEKKLTRTGNSRTLTITRDMRCAMGLVGDVVDIQIMGDQIILSRPKPQSFDEAVAATFDQYDNAIRSLKD